MGKLPEILFAHSFSAELRAQIGPTLTIAGPFDSPIEKNLKPEEAASIRVLATIGVLKTDAALMERLPNLSLICCFGSGYEGVDVAEALRRGIMVTHSPAANAGTVADLAMALLLAANRKIVVADKFVRDGLWQNYGAGRMQAVKGMEGLKIGIYGYGAIGAKIAARAAAFETEIGYCSNAPKPGVPYLYQPTLLALAQWADVLMIAVRATASNRHAVGAKVMRALGPEGMVINITRGSVVDETALIELLESGELGSAGLDVFEHEPAVPERLKALPQVVLTPHIGGGTRHALAAMQDMMVANIAAFFAEGRVLNPVPELVGLNPGR